MEDQPDQECGASYSDLSFSKPGTFSKTEEDMNHDFTESSPPIMDLSKDKSRTTDGRQRNIPPLKRLFPSQSTPDLLGDDPPLIEPDCCTSAIYFCSNSMIKLRNSAFMHIVQLVLSSIPISAVVMGVLFTGNCPKAPFLPIVGAVAGAIGTLFMAAWIYVTCTHRRGHPCSNRQTFLLGMLAPVLIVLTILDMIFVFSLWPSSDPASPDYCNQTFSNFAFYKEIATVVAIVLSVMLYLPGSRHILCCTNCSMRSPAYYVSF